MITRRRAWDPRLKNEDIKGFIIAGERPKWPERILTKFGPELMELIESAWDQNPKDRPSFKKINEIMQQQLGYVSD